MGFFKRVRFVQRLSVRTETKNQTSVHKASGYTQRKAFKKSRWLFLTLIALLYSSQALAAAPVPTLTTNVPAQPFVGEQSCFIASLTNMGDHGYGPYYQLIMGSDFTFASANLFGLSVASTAINGAFPGLVDPVSGQTVLGPAGGNLTLLTLPIGSVVDGGLPLDVEICVDVNRNATPEVLQSDAVQVVPVYEFGDTPTGINGFILGNVVKSDVTPKIIRFRELQTAPEEENPPGVAFTFSDIYVADIASDLTVTPVDFVTMDIDDGRQFVGPVTVTGGTGCTVTVTNSANVAQSGNAPFSPSHMSAAGGKVDVSCTSGTGTIGSDTDIQVDIPMYIIDILNPQSCASESNPGNQTAKHVVVRKSASVSAARPGTSIDFSLSFAVSEYASADYIAMEDVLPDGYTFTPGSQSLSIGGAAYAIVPTISNDTPSGGQTTLFYDVSAVYGADFAANTTGVITYSAVIDQSYANGQAVRANDSLSNSVEVFYSLRNGAGSPGSYCIDTSSATVLIETNQISKTIVNPKAEYMPGDTVIYRLRMDVASGDTQGIFFNDYFPLPVFDASKLSTQTSLGANPDISLGPNDTLGLDPLSIVVNASQNKLTFEWSSIDTTSSQTIEVDVSIQIEDTPFADDLFLTNLLSTFSENTPGTVSTMNAGVFLKLRSPVLSIKKTATPVNNLDAGDAISFDIEVENTGGAPAYNVTLKDTLPSSLTGCSITSAPAGSGDMFNLSGYELTNSIAAGGMVNLVIGCTIDNSVEIGSTQTNTVGVTWASRPGAVAFPEVSTTESFSIRNLTPTKGLVSSSESHTADTLVNLMPVTIGEIVRFKLIAEIPEGRLSNFRIYDVMPGGLIFLNDGTAKVALISNSGNITTDIANLNSCGTLHQVGDETTLDSITPSCDISPTGSSFSSGTDPVFRMSSSAGFLENTDNDVNKEYIVIELNARVMDISANENRDVLTNRTRVRTSTQSRYSSSSAEPKVRVVEPLLKVSKSANVGSVDAGDSITYSVGISHIATGSAAQQSQVDAFDLQLNDIIPSGLMYSANTFTATCSGGVTPTLNDSDPAGVGLSLTLSSLPLGETCSLEYQVVAQIGVMSNQQIQNTAQLAWNTLPSDGTGGNATGSDAVAGDERDYTDSATKTIEINDPVPVKSIVSTSMAHTVDTSADSSTDPRLLSINETIRYRLVTQIPEGTANNVLIIDSLPSGLQYIAGTSAFAFVTNDTGITSALTCDGGTGTVAVSGNETNIDSIIPDCGITAAGPFRSGTDPIFNLGNVLNQDSDSDSEYVIIEFDARVVNETANQNAKSLTNTFKLSIDSVNFNDSNVVYAKVVEPKVDLSATIIITGNDSARFTLVFENTGEATAFQVGGNDQSFWQFDLPEGLRDISAVTLSTIGNVTENATATSVQNTDLSISGGDNDTLSLNKLLQMDPGAKLEITFDVQQVPGIIPSSSTSKMVVEYAAQSSGNTTTSIRTGEGLSSGTGNSPITSTATQDDYRTEWLLEVYQISGHVFEDVNVDGIRDSDESGLGNVTVVLKGGASCQSIKTNADGRYGFFPVMTGSYTVYESANTRTPIPANCPPTAKDLSLYKSVTPNNKNVTVTNANVTDVDFADIRQPTFAPNHSGTVLPGNVVFYAHKFAVRTKGTVSFSSTASGNTTNGWAQQIYKDTNCDGALNGAEASAPISSSFPVIAEDEICLITKVFAPANVAANDQYVVDIVASFDYGNPAVPVKELAIQNVTKASQRGETESRLELVKTVKNITQGTAETKNQNQAKPGDTLEYRIRYINVGTGPITDLKVNDSSPAFTLLQANSASCDTTPTGLTCSPQENGPDVKWLFTGVLKGGEEGLVSYRVLIE